MGFSYIYLLFKWFIQKGGFNIHLIDRLTVLICNTDNKPNGFNPNNRCKYLLKVYAFSLQKSLIHYQALCLIISHLRFSFTLNTQFTPIGFFPFGRPTRSQVLFFPMDFGSYFIAQIHFGSLKASFVLTGSNSAISEKWTKSTSLLTSLSRNNLQYWSL